MSNNLTFPAFFLVDNLEGRKLFRCENFHEVADLMRYLCLKTAQGIYCKIIYVAPDAKSAKKATPASLLPWDNLATVHGGKENIIT